MPLIGLQAERPSTRARQAATAATARPLAHPDTIVPGQAGSLSRCRSGGRDCRNTTRATLLLCHGPSPGSGLLPAAFDVMLEPFKVSLYPLRDDADGVSNIFNKALRIIFHLEHDFGFGIRDGLKRHDTGIDGASPA